MIQNYELRIMGFEKRAILLHWIHVKRTFLNP